MITIKCNLCNINQEKYDEIINNLDFNRLICPKCDHSDLIIHGYYTRRLKTKIGTIYLVYVSPFNWYSNSFFDAEMSFFVSMLFQKYYLANTLN